MIYDFEYIPNDWKVVNIEQVGKIIGGGTPSTKNEEYWGGNINWFTPTEITNLSNLFIFESERKITKEGLNNSSAKLIPENSLLFTSRATIGACAINSAPASTNQGFQNIVPIEDISVKYLYYFFSQPLMQKRLIRRANGSTFLEVSGSEMRKTKILLPPKIERIKIVGILENIDFLIQITQRLIEKLQECKKGLMQRLFTEGIGHTEFKSYKQKNIPISWEILDFQESVKKNKQILGSLKKSEYKNEGLYPVIDQGQEFIAGYSDKEDLIYNGELPIVIFGDHTRIFKFIDFRFICGADGTKVLIPNTEYFDPLFLYYYFSHLRIKNLGYSRHFKLLKESIILKPEIEEQTKISNILGNIDRSIHKELEYKKKLIEIKKGLMQILLTGKKRVPV